MGPADQPGSVTAPDGRVHGLHNLRIAGDHHHLQTTARLLSLTELHFDGALFGADASIMPSVVRAHTHVTAIAIGERIAQMVREERVRLEEVEQAAVQPRL